MIVAQRVPERLIWRQTAVILNVPFAIADYGADRAGYVSEMWKYFAEAIQAADYENTSGGVRHYSYDEIDKITKKIGERPITRTYPARRSRPLLKILEEPWLRVPPQGGRNIRTRAFCRSTPPTSSS